MNEQLECLLGWFKNGHTQPDPINLTDQSFEKLLKNNEELSRRIDARGRIYIELNPNHYKNRLFIPEHHTWVGITLKIYKGLV